jgi:putative heme-binding domain-containing protein
LDGRGGEHAPNIATEPKIQALPDGDLLRIVRTGIPSAGMPGFASTLKDEQIQAVLEYLRTLQGIGLAVSLPGNPERGKALFFQSAGCSSCHMMNGRGGFLGADLSAYGSTHNAAEIREAILDPNKDLDPRRGPVIVTTRSGRKYTGVIRNEDNFSLQMQTLDGNFHMFEKSSVARVERPSHSLMPSNYEAQLGNRGIDDVVSYLIRSAAGKPSNAQRDDDE